MFEKNIYKLVLRVAIAGLTCAWCSAAIRYDVTDLCGQLLPVSDVTKESYVIRIPPRPAYTSVCDVRLPEAITNMHQFVVRMDVLDQLKPNQTRHDCSWLTLNRENRQYDMCNDVDVMVMTTDIYYIRANYTAGTMAAREDGVGGYNVIVTPFHFLACDYVGDVACINFDSYVCDDYESTTCDQYGKSRCPITCGICTPPPCHDVDVLCFSRAIKGWCEHRTMRRYYMQPDCQYTCEYCERNYTSSCCHYNELAGMEEEIQFHTCDVHRCLPMSVVCDGVTNCVDGSDEWPGCTPYTDSGTSNQPIVLAVLLLVGMVSARVVLW